MKDLRDAIQENGDSLSDLENKFREDIDKIFEHADKKQIVNSPDKFFAVIQDAILEVFKKKYKKTVIKNSIEMTKDIINNVQS